MDPEPMNRYEPPAYPEKDELSADHPVLTRMPRRWQRNAAVLALLTATAALVAGAAPAEFWQKAGCCASNVMYQASSLMRGRPRQLPGAAAPAMPLNEGDIPSVVSGIVR